MKNGYCTDMAARPKSKQTGPVSSAVSALRSAAGMTQQELANFLGVAVPTVGRWETGRVPDKKFLKMLLEMTINLGRRDLREVFRLALLEDAGIEALLSIQEIGGHLAFAQSHLAYLTTSFQEFRKGPLTEAETMQIADEVWKAISRAKRLADVLDFNSPHFGSQVARDTTIDDLVDQIIEETPPE